MCLYSASFSDRLIYSGSSPPYILGKSLFEKLLPIASENRGSREDVGVTDMSDHMPQNKVGDPNILTFSDFQQRSAYIIAQNLLY